MKCCFVNEQMIPWHEKVRASKAYKSWSNITDSERSFCHKVGNLGTQKEMLWSNLFPLEMSWLEQKQLSKNREEMGSRTGKGEGSEAGEQKSGEEFMLETLRRGPETSTPWALGQEENYLLLCCDFCIWLSPQDYIEPIIGVSQHEYVYTNMFYFCYFFCTWKS